MSDRRNCGPARRRLGALPACAAFMLSGWVIAADNTTPPAETERSAVVTAVAGIVSYTRWPADATAIRLCTLGQGPGVAALQKSSDFGPSQRPVSVHVLTDAGPASSSACHVVYIGTAGGDATRELLRRLAGQPVLMLGEGAAFCSDGGMFCLEPGATQVRFNANLDAIARSGLRVNPLVLRIARGSVAGGS